MARTIRREPPRWSRQVIQQSLLPVMPQLQAASMTEVRAALAMWWRDPVVAAAAYDQDRFVRLHEIVERRLRRLLAPSCRRMIFNVVRGLTPPELLAFCCAADLGTRDLGQVLLEATRAVCWYAKPATRERPVGDAVKLTSREKAQLSALPETVARTVGLASLAHLVAVAYRRAGKGLALRLDDRGLPVRAGPPGPGLGWVWQADDELEAAVAEYDARRAASGETPVGLPAWRHRDILDPDAVLWMSAGRIPFPVTVRYPALGREYLTYGFMFSYRNIAQRLDHIDGYDSVLRDRFGLGAAALRRICVALAQMLHHSLGLTQMAEMESDKSGFWFVSSLGDRESHAPRFLEEVLCEGVVRAPYETWIDLIANAAAEHGRVTPAEARAFVDAFTSHPRPASRDLAPVLFHHLENGMVALDLVAAEEFVDLCFRALVVGRTGATGGAKGALFESLARAELVDRLGLTQPYPVPPGYKLRRAKGVIKAEVDFCFWWRGVLVHLDMKSMSRKHEIHTGEFGATRNRTSELDRYLRKQVQPCAVQLAQVLRARGERFETVVSLLCTADVEYIPPGPHLRYGRVPRVLTATEIADLLLDDRRWTEVVTAAEAQTAA